uniref:non-specific serine/threonine protein kinase n=1 Tax=Acrobeloides nanus TaxID=290746 RepID=A0A914C3W7_9BILA
MTLPVFAKKVKKIATLQFLNIKLLLNGRGFSKFKKNYRLKGELGQGGFGVVYRAIRISDEMPVAVKFIERRQVRDWGKLNDERVPLEICMLARCSKISGVICLIDWYSMPEGYLIVMERPTPCMDLFDFIRAHKALDEELARFFFKQIVQTVDECAQRKVLHRDLKDENIVIDLMSGDTRLIDFGAATLLKKTRYHDFQGTRLYTPPEWFLHSLYLGREAAVWSLGILLYNMVNGRLPFQNEKDICTAHLLGPLPFFANISDEARDLIEKCLTFDPFSRISLDEVLKHPWLARPTADWLNLTVTLKLFEAESLLDSETVDSNKNEQENVEREESGMESCESENSSPSCSQDERVAPDSQEEVCTGMIKPETSVLHKPGIDVRRNAKTSLLQSKPIDFQMAPKDHRLKNKTKSGNIRPNLRETRLKHAAESIDSGISSVALHCSQYSLQSPLASPLFTTKPCVFPEIAENSP